MRNINEIIVSGYTQRLSKKTGNIEDEYIISVDVNRAQWAKINSRHPELVNPVETMEIFTLRRNMTATGIMKTIVPFDSCNRY